MTDQGPAAFRGEAATDDVTTVHAGGRVVVPGAVLDPGWVAERGGRIVGVGSGTPPFHPSDAAPVGPVTVVDRSGDWVLAGFVDVHVHGGGGHTITTGDPDEAAAALAFHRRHGTTTSALSLVTAPVDRLVESVGRLAGLVDATCDDDGAVASAAGIHLEGPFLSTAACGAQDPTAMVPPTPDAVDRLLDAGRGRIRLVTIAPELPGALAAIRHLVERGVVVAVGHTAATHDETRAAIDAGATVATHLFNCMGAFHHRAPGAVGALLDDERVVCELILDGHHVHPTAARVASAVATPARIALVTDAIALAGVGDGDVALGPHAVEVRGGVPRVRGSGALAGSTLTMDAAFRAAVDLGHSVPAASAMASAVPAEVLGVADTRGTIEVGKFADLVVLDDRWQVRTVLRRGRPIR